MATPHPRDDSVARVLLVDDDPLVARALAAVLERVGHAVVAVHSGQAALDALSESRLGTPGAPPRPFAVLVADQSMPGMDGIELLRRVGREFPEVVPIIVTAFGTIESAVRAVRLGAFDYLTKPIVDDELALAVEKANQQHHLRAENQRLRGQLGDQFDLEGVLGHDPRMRRTFEVVRAVAASRTTVLMTGESGTGKSLIARAIHRASARAAGPFVELACGSIPETLLESELFGHVKGAFTGAHVDKPGRFLAAEGGTIFLDEINSASPGMQLKLLRVLQERTFEPIGSNESVTVDVRVVLASNQPLEDLVAAGTFRQDLYYRINVVAIDLPPLRERVADIPLLAEHFLVRAVREAERQVTGFEPEALEALQRYRFPGNVRELQNIVERAVVLSRTPRLGIEDLPDQVARGERGSASAPVGVPWRDESGHVSMTLAEALEEPEKRIIVSALEANTWNRQSTADELGINRTTLYKKMKRFGLAG